jgi:hypothetical protein
VQGSSHRSCANCQAFPCPRRRRVHKFQQSRTSCPEPEPVFCDDAMSNRLEKRPNLGSRCGRSRRRRPTPPLHTSAQYWSGAQGFCTGTVRLHPSTSAHQVLRSVSRQRILMCSCARVRLDQLGPSPDRFEGQKTLYSQWLQRGQLRCGGADLMAGARSFAPGIHSWRLNGEWRRPLGCDATRNGGAIIRLDPRATDSTQSQIAAVPCTAHNRLTDLREFGLFGVT